VILDFANYSKKKRANEARFGRLKRDVSARLWKNQALGLNSLINVAKHIDLYLSAATVVFRHTFYQRRFTVLDSTADRQNSLAILGWDAVGLEYMPTLLSKHAAYRLRVFPRVQQMAQPAGTSSSAFTSFTLDCDLPFLVSDSRTGSNRVTTGKS
jgi:hypothetical protein